MMNGLARCIIGQMAAYYKMLGKLLSIKFEEIKMDRAWFGLRKKRGLPPVPVEG